MVISFISIPFSTIKRENRQSLRQSSQIFQFHLVRLKVSENNVERWRTQFQFHLVRLKASISHCFTRIYQFQFHLVRLKAEAIKKAKEAFRFQFHLVRLKERAHRAIHKYIKDFNSI